MNLWNLKPGTEAIIDSVEQSDRSNWTALLELGFRENTKIRCLHKTAFGGPRVFEINGDLVCTLCKQSAQSVAVKPL